jgi:hypothetical protein
MGRDFCGFVSVRESAKCLKDVEMELSTEAKPAVGGVGAALHRRAAGGYFIDAEV